MSTPNPANARANALADRLEQGAAALTSLARGLNDAQWQTPIPHDGRKVGVVVHHVASVYPIEIQLAQALAAGNPVTGVSWNDVHTMNAGHAKDNDTVTKEAALALLAANSATAAAAIRQMSDAQLDAANTNSLYGDAPLSCQHMLEDHAVRHSYHHTAKIKAALGL